MDWLFWTTAGAVVAWIAEKVMDALLERWRAARRRPLNEVRALRRKRWRFGLAVASLTYCLLVLAIVGADVAQRGLTDDNRWWLLLFAALTAYLVRVTRRRWQRLPH